MKEIEHFTQNLPFSFSESLPASLSNFLPTLRTLHHRAHESLRDQCIFTIVIARKVHTLLSSYQITTQQQQPVAPFRLAIWIADVSPGTALVQARYILSAALRVMPEEEVVIIARKESGIREFLGPDYNKIPVYWNWEDRKFLASHPLVIHLSTTTHAQLTPEVLRNQDRTPPTIFISNMTALPLARLCGLLGTELVIRPAWAFTEREGDAKRGDKTATWSFERTPRGFVLPDVDRLRAVLTSYCKSHGLNLDEAARLVAQALPPTVVQW
ncbi:hypothetical protein HK104_002544 [Borealophlyctis nickersoniae]|nr:hypothetical protein HK104_002544 [Borealophlyctis nickersoniae]